MNIIYKTKNYKRKVKKTLQKLFTRRIKQDERVPKKDIRN